MDNSEDIEEEKKARPENEIKPEVKSFNDEIEQKAAEMQAQHGENSTRNASNRQPGNMPRRTATSTASAPTISLKKTKKT